MVSECTFEDALPSLMRKSLFKPVLSFSDSVKSRTLANTRSTEDLSDVAEDK